MPKLDRQAGRRKRLLYRRQDRHFGKGVGGRYQEAGANTFTAIIPADNPQYQLLVMLDERRRCRKPKASSLRLDAVPTGGKVIARIAPLLGVEPRRSAASDRLILAASRTTQ